MPRSRTFFPAALLMGLALALPAEGAERAANAVFLVAKRELRDPNFRETVVLVTHPGRGGPFGVIINRPLARRVDEIFTEYESLKGRPETLFFGGPVASGGLVFLVRGTKPPPGATRFLRDVYLTPDVEQIDALMRRADPLRGLRIYAGHAGWAPGQLQGEIARGGWHVLPADAETVFEKDPARIWPELEKRATTKQTGHGVAPLAALGH